LRNHQNCQQYTAPTPTTSLITQPTPPRPTWPNHQTNLLDLPINGIDLGDQVRINTPVQVAGRNIILENKVGVVWDYTAQIFIIWNDSNLCFYRAFKSVEPISKGQQPP